MFHLSSNTCISSNQTIAYKTHFFLFRVFEILHQTVSEGNNRFSLASGGDVIPRTGIFSVDISSTKTLSDVSDSR